MEQNKLERAVNAAVWAILACVSLYLFLVSIFSTSYISVNPQLSEYTYFLRDNPFVHGAAILAALGAAAVLVKHRDDKRWRSFLEKSMKYLLLFSVGAAVLWQLMTQMEPAADQQTCLDIAAQLKRKNFQEFRTGGYISLCPHQLGLIFAEFLLGLLWGDHNYMAYRLLNTACMAYICRSVYKLMQEALPGRIRNLAGVLGIALFVPYLFSGMFLYGTIPGLALALLAVRLEYSYLKKPGLGKMAGACAAVSAACILKSNYLIVMIAMLIVLVWDILKKKKWKRFVFPVLLVLVCVTGGRAVRLFMEAYTGKEIGEGVPMISYVTMGLEKGYSTEGWFDSYTYWNYEAAGYDSDAAKETAVRDLSASLAGFAADPKSALAFFSYKTASQWNNPSFQIFWQYQKARPGIKPPGFVHSILYGRGNLYLYGLLNILHSVILFGAVCFILAAGKKMDIRKHILLLYLLGGFFFHMFWEGKAYYILPYFIMLIPYSVHGYEVFARRLLERKWKEAAFGAAAVAAVGAVNLPAVDTLLKPERDTAYFEEYVTSLSEKRAVKNGYYTIQSAGAGLLLSTQDESMEDGARAALCEAADAKERKIYVRYEEGWYTLRFYDSQMVLEAGRLEEQEISTAFQKWDSGSGSQKWQFEEAENGAYYILSADGQALTWDGAANGLTLSEFGQSENQKWKLVSQK